MHHSLLVACVAVTAVLQTSTAESSPPTTTCPKDAFKRTQGCLQDAGVLSAALRSIVNPGFSPFFCGTSSNDTVDCLRNVLDLCSDNPSRLALLRLQVDPDGIHDNLRYFCRNRHVLKGEVNCTDYQEASTCTERAAAKLQESLALTSEFKPVLDTHCLFNDDLRQCLTGTLGQKCNGTRQLYLRLTRAARFPYCDLSQLQQHVRLHQALVGRPLHNQQQHRQYNAVSGASARDGGSGSDRLVVVGRAGFVGRVCVAFVVLLGWRPASA